MKTEKRLSEPAGAPAPQHFLKARPLAAKIGIHPRTVHRWAAAGAITPRRVNARTVLFSEAEVFAFIESCRG